MVSDICIEAIDLHSFYLKLCEGLPIKMNFDDIPSTYEIEFGIWIHEVSEYALYCCLFQMGVPRKCLGKEVSRLCNNGHTINQMITHIVSACHTESYVKFKVLPQLITTRHFAPEKYCALILTKYKRARNLS